MPALIAPAIAVSARVRVRMALEAKLYRHNAGDTIVRHTNAIRQRCLSAAANSFSIKLGWQRLAKIKAGLGVSFPHSKRSGPVPLATNTAAFFPSMATQVCNQNHFAARTSKGAFAPGWSV